MRCGPTWSPVKADSLLQRARVACAGLFFCLLSFPLPAQDPFLRSLAAAIDRALRQTRKPSGQPSSVEEQSARAIATASAAPSIASWASQITPSRSLRMTLVGSLLASTHGSLLGFLSATVPMVWPSCHARCQPVRVPRFEPFAALRFSTSLPLDQVAAPPYDVLSDRDIDQLLAQHPRNIVAIDVPREADGPNRYAEAANRIHGGSADRAVAHSTSGPCLQQNLVAVLEGE